MRSMARTLLLSFFIVFISSWGFLVHRTVNQLAVYELPKSMQPFFYKNMEYLVKHSVRPDLRRNEDATEATKDDGGPSYRYVYVDQESFERHKPSSFAGLTSTFREHQEA